MRIGGGGPRGGLRGLVENEARQELARTLMRSGPLTVRALVEATGRSRACSHYHLRALAAAGAVKPKLVGVAAAGDLAWALDADDLPAWERDILLGEISFRTLQRFARWVREWLDDTDPEDGDRPY